MMVSMLLFAKATPSARTTSTPSSKPLAPRCVHTQRFHVCVCVCVCLLRCLGVGGLVSACMSDHDTPCALCACRLASSLGRLASTPSATEAPRATGTTSSNDCEMVTLLYGYSSRYRSYCMVSTKFNVVCPHACGRGSVHSCIRNDTRGCARVHTGTMCQ